jgi:hypothetical protein
MSDPITVNRNGEGVKASSLSPDGQKNILVHHKGLTLAGGIELLTGVFVGLALRYGESLALERQLRRQMVVQPECGQNHAAFF